MDPISRRNVLTAAAAGTLATAVTAVAARAGETMPPTPARRGCGIVSPACAPTAVTAVTSVPAAAAVNTLRREIGSMASSLTFCDWRR